MLDKSFYCGDSAGRVYNPTTKKEDYSDVDLKFALNIGVDFKVPESIFCDELDKDKKKPKKG